LARVVSLAHARPAGGHLLINGGFRATDAHGFAPLAPASFFAWASPVSLTGASARFREFDSGTFRRQALARRRALRALAR